MMSASGKFLEKGEKIIFPVTEDSVSRSSGIAPHRLSEEISYLMKEEKNKNDETVITPSENYKWNNLGGLYQSFYKKYEKFWIKWRK